MTYSHFEEKMNTNTKAKPIPHVHFCHCSNCRKSSGSYVSANLRIESKTITIADPQGSLKKYEDGDTASGNVVVREFCGGCGW